MKRVPDDVLGSLRRARIDRATTLMEALVRVGNPMLFAETGDRASCILAAFMGEKVLRRFGVESRPMGVRVVACNPQARPHVLAGTQPSDEEHDVTGATISIAGYLDAAEHHARYGNGAYYNGHVVLVVSEKYVLDLTADQFTRDEHGIVVPPIVFTAEDGFLTEGVPRIVCDLPNGGLISYEFNTDDSWRDSADYTEVADLVMGDFSGKLAAAISAESGVEL